MHHIYNNGLIQDFEAGEDIINNNFYIINRKDQKIYLAKTPDDWMYNEVVYVYNDIPIKDFYLTKYFGDDIVIEKGTICRCWRVKIFY